MKTVLAAVAAALLLAIAGCGGDDEGDSTAAATQAGASTQAGGSTQSGADTSGGESSGGGGDFCEQLQNVDDEILSTPDPTNASDVAKTFQDAADALEGVDAPGEIEEDWNTLTGTFRGWAEAFEGVDLNDPDSLANAQELLSTIQEDQQKLLDATQRIGEYASAECGIELGDAQTG
ncbi:MAG TPA: hypothetical protein VNZ62_20305 [Capillimicrobium sp.]|nr:hypothetical protein [Capillimicrobium sp.]